MTARAAVGGWLLESLSRAALTLKEPRRSVLAHYSGRRPWRQRLLLGSLFVVVLVVCVLYGAAYAVLTPYLLPVLAVPVLVLGAITIWAAPTLRRPPLNLLIALFYIYLVASYVWPNYLAIAVPGLPWMTVVRLVGIPTIVVLAICLSTSTAMQSAIKRAWRGFPTLFVLMTLFLIIQTFSIFLSNQKAQSVDKLVVVLTGQVSLFLIASYVLQDIGRIYGVLYILWATAIFVCTIGLWQYKIKALPWAGHTPSFLQINDPTVAAVLAGFGRSYTSVYRVTSTFTTPLGMSEFIAIIFPFVLFFLFKGKHLLIRALAALTIPLLLGSVVLTDSRLGIVGCLLAMLIYPLIIGLRLWRRRRSSLLGPAIGVAYPLIFAGVIAATFLIGHLRSAVWGSGAKNFSTQSRIEQWHLAAPLILHRPVGYGIGRAADTLGYAPFGVETIDSYYLSMALDYGIVGAAVFYSIFLVSAAKAATIAVFRAPGGEEVDLLVPASISIMAWLVIKSVFSQTDNNGLIYVLVGMIAALVCRLQAPYQRPKGWKSRPPYAARPGSDL